MVLAAYTYMWTQCRFSDLIFIQSLLFVCPRTQNKYVRFISVILE